MNILDVKEKIYDIVDMFFTGASVVWVEQTATRPNTPYITLKTGSVNRTFFATSDDSLKKKYSCSPILEINLYTKGTALKIGGKSTKNNINTALSDMTDFVNFLESPEITDIISKEGMSIYLNPPVRDLTELQNDSNFRYRSMAEFTVTWPEVIQGAYGSVNMDITPNSSGGGTEAYTNAENNIIENIEIEGGFSDEE